MKRPAVNDNDPRTARFRDYWQRLHRNSVRADRVEGERHSCPCCKYLTLDERGGYEICPICFWEDDGQDEAELHTIRGGANGRLSLAEARTNFATFRACEKRFRSKVRDPRPDEVP
jgi:hypothetical protein